ncbi:hypothetical protein [Actinotalea solisilvae]|uniref:hypothetical protein n=1 Tax=Actinotalea solisilvae TaxID=2072922 RepID=UPI0018F15837|nr:hypothetical protein [Actinotalea solisilvae]
MVDPGADGRGRRAGVSCGLPLEDRSPRDGDLFSLELLYSLQTARFRREHLHRLGVIAAGERRRMRYIALELEARRLGVAFLAPPAGGWALWRYCIARTMSDDELLEERRTAYDRLLRALGQMSLAFRPFDMLLTCQAGVAPSVFW